jgi:hypothetical protein
VAWCSEPVTSNDNREVGGAVERALKALSRGWYGRDGQIIARGELLGIQGAATCSDCRALGHADDDAIALQWIANRELALAPDRWGVQVANERGGHSRRLPGLAFWPEGDDELHVAMVVVQGQSNPRGERAALVSWHASNRPIYTGPLPGWSRRRQPPATCRHEIGLTAPQFIVGEPPVLPSVVENVDEVLGESSLAGGAGDAERFSAVRLAGPCANF